MQQPNCDLCGDPTDPAAYVCRRCSNETAGYLRKAVTLAGEVETTVAKLARYATRGGRRAAPADDEDGAVAGPANRRQLVKLFGWPASKDRPKPGALRTSAPPVNLNASAKAAYAFNALTTQARMIEEERGVQVDIAPGQHPAAAAAAFLIGQLDWIRFQRDADQTNEQLRAAGAAIERVVDAPPEMEIVGVCDCGEHLYAYEGATTVTCQGCGAKWDVATSRETLKDTLRGYLMTPSEAAVLLMLFGLTGNRDRSRKTIVMWAQRARIVKRGERDGDPVYLFGEILDMAVASATASVRIGV